MLNQIRAMHADLSKSEKKVASTVLDEPQKYVNATLNELANGESNGK